jgi:hypothetical protein
MALVYPLRPPVQPKAELSLLSVRDLKTRLAAVGAPACEVASCVEKIDLVQLLYRSLGGGDASCAICLSDNILGVLMPCCGREGSTLAYCRRCLEIICERADHGARGVGMCPTCRKPFNINANGQVSNTILRGRCRMCCQQTELTSRGSCDACEVGGSHNLRFTCDRCESTQRIPHPMWRYQATPDAFGTSTWACHQQCGDYTHWRVHPDDAHLVPDNDCPDGWGRRDVWLQEIRAARRLEIEAASLQGEGTGSM